MNKFVQFFRVPSLAFLGASFLVGCSQDSMEPQQLGGSPLLVTVNGERITERDLNASLNALFGEEQASLLDDKARQKALEGLVLSRVIAQKRLAEISADELQAIEDKLRYQKEKLLVTDYLEQHASPTPVTDAMVTSYYQRNIAKYGGGEFREFEMIQGSATLAETERGKVVAQLEAALSAQDWNTFVKQQNADTSILSYSKAVLNPAVHDEKIVILVNSLSVGKPSQTMMLGGVPTVARVINVEQREPVPLHQVSGGIRKKLVPQQIKKAIVKLQTEVLKDADIQYKETR